MCCRGNVLNWCHCVFQSNEKDKDGSGSNRGGENSNSNEGKDNRSVKSCTDDSINQTLLNGKNQPPPSTKSASSNEERRLTRVAPRSQQLKGKTKDQQASTSSANLVTGSYVLVYYKLSRPLRDDRQRRALMMSAGNRRWRRSSYIVIHIMIRSDQNIYKMRALIVIAVG